MYVLELVAEFRETGSILSKYIGSRHGSATTEVMQRAVLGQLHTEPGSVRQLATGKEMRGSRFHRILRYQK